MAQAPAAKETGGKPASAAGKPSPIPTDVDCDECGKPMISRTGRSGRCLGCSGYPKCKNTAEVPAKLVEELGLNGNGNGNGAANGKAAKESHAQEEEEIETDLRVD